MKQKYCKAVVCKSISHKDMIKKQTKSSQARIKKLAAKLIAEENLRKK